jgi:hypothetical protein
LRNEFPVAKNRFSVQYVLPLPDECEHTSTIRKSNRSRRGWSRLRLANHRYGTNAISERCHNLRAPGQLEDEICR